jgi:hypothetical protein
MANARRVKKNTANAPARLLCVVANLAQAAFIRTRPSMYKGGSMLRFSIRASMLACLLIAANVAIGQNAGNGKQVAQARQASQPAGGPASGAQTTAPAEGAAAGGAGAIAAAAAAVLAAASGGGGGSATPTHSTITHATSH